MEIQTTDFFNQDSGVVTLRRGRLAMLPWSQVAVTVYNENRERVNTATGTVSGSALRVGSGKFEPFENTINLGSTDWSWNPERAAVQEFQFAVMALTEDFSIRVTVASW